LEAIKHILIIRLSSMGDVAMTVPIIRLVKRRSPSTKISILTKPSYIEIFREFKEANIISIDFTIFCNSYLFKLSLFLFKYNFMNSSK